MKRILLLMILLPFAIIAFAQDATVIYKNTVNSTVTIETDDKLGSGFFVSEGIIATNYHVIRGDTEAYCYTNNSDTQYKIEGYVAVDTSVDLILLKVTGLRRTPIRISATPVEVGQKVYVIGSPKGLPATISDGIVSALRDFDGYKLIQITAPISPGSSGGPVLNSMGELIGVSVGQFREGQNLNFTIPKANLKLLLSNKRIYPLSLSILNGDIETQSFDSLPAIPPPLNSEITHKTVIIGGQEWTAKNLNVSTFRNGDPIPEAESDAEWVQAGKEGKPAWCYYNNDPANGEKYGKLYNWYAVNDSRGLAPQGWHISTSDELITFIKNLGGHKDIGMGTYTSGNKMKSITGWENNGNGDNSSGFSAFPGGARSGSNNPFNNLGYIGYFWSGTEQDSVSAVFYSLGDDSDVLLFITDKGEGYSVRCVRDNVIVTATVKPVNVQIRNNGATVMIGTQEWATKNLNVSTFRNGDPIPEAESAAEWNKAGDEGKPAWCYYDNDPANGEKYGKLYNWYAINDSRGLAPQGWHIPTHAEWTTLINYLGGENEAGIKMKSTSGWEDNGNGDNSSGFSALPVGIRCYHNDFYGLGKYEYFWSFPESDSDYAWFLSLIDYKYSEVGFSYGQVSWGFSCRCIKDY